MPAKLSDYEYILFKKFIEEKSGIEISQEKAYLIETRLEGFLKELKLGSFQQLYFAAQSDHTLADKIIDAITTNETLWFRDQLPWQYLESTRMKRYVDELRNKQKTKIRIWSVASSTGQEAYSAAMMIDRYLEIHHIADVTLSQFEIIATDISQAALDIARKGRFDSIAILRGLDSAYRDKYFKKIGLEYEIDEKIRNSVSFQKFNLQNSFIMLGTFDIIFLRYVMIYFSQRLRLEIAQKLQSSLRNDGVLFLGSSELYKCISSNFATHYFKKGMFYTKANDRLKTSI